LRPDPIVVAEVWDGLALHLLEAWNTAHPGALATRPHQWSVDRLGHSHRTHRAGDGYRISCGQGADKAAICL